MYRPVSYTHLDVYKRQGELNAKLQDNLSGLHEIQSFGQEELESGQVKEKNFEQVRAMLRALRASAVFHPCVEFLSSVGTVPVSYTHLDVYKRQI